MAKRRKTLEEMFEEERFTCADCNTRFEGHEKHDPELNQCWGCKDEEDRRHGVYVDPAARVHCGSW